MTMDFSQLHIYTPPQCAPENTGYTYSLSSSYSTAALEFELEHQIPPVYDSPRMSRRSLRLQGSENLVDYSQNHSSSSKRETRTLRSRKQQQSTSRTLSLSHVATPRKTLSFSAVSTPIDNSSESKTSDASQLTSTHNQSLLRCRTLTTTTTTVDGHWGQSSTHSQSNVNGGASSSHTSLANGYICKNCSPHSQTADSCSTPSSSSQAAELSTDVLSPCSLIGSSIYTRDRSRRNGVLVSVSNTCLRYSKRALAPVVSLVSIFFSSVVWLCAKAKSSPGKAHSSFCGSMNVKDLVTEDGSHLDLNGSLCDDCKGKQFSETHIVHLTRSQRLLAALWSSLAYAGYCVTKAVSTGTHRVLSFFWMLLAAPVKAGTGLLWFLARGWYQLVALMSLINVFFLTQCFPRLWKLLLHLLLFLLLLALWFWAPSTAALLAYLPALNITEWSSASPVSFFSNPAALSASDPSPESPMETTAAASLSQQTTVLHTAPVSTLDLERLERVEQQLALLWEQIKQDDQKQQRRHGDLLGLYEKLSEQTDKASLAAWVSSLLEERLSALRAEMKQENTLAAQSAEQQKKQHESHTARLDGLVLLLNALSAKTEELQTKQQQYEREMEEKGKEKEDVPPPAEAAPLSVGVKQEEHDALLTEVQRLEAELGQIREDLQGVAGCKGKCQQLDTLQETVSAQVSSQLRKELQAVFFGSASAGEQQGEVPESLLQWLSERYVTTPDLQAALASLELNILKNISLQLELSRAQTLAEAEERSTSFHQAVTGAVRHSSAAEGLTEEQVKLIVSNALKLYSQDRTGLVDYALESGGGSILSTRCSETYETKTALMSLFGLPLWYFSQSPRVVIQPDVYPGNCWAFKGSQGYLVIRLSLRIRPTSFCVEHIPKALSPTGNITSAPRNFTVYGLDDEYQEEGKLLGQYVYEENGESLQSFPVQEENDKTFQIIEVRVSSNWGHPEYTCLYRFRVHGEPRPQ